ncbi:YkvA family protein [Mycobacterium sp. Marseille-P9652]|uniref:YkvA family protein n=1 Tax=Mycobacterium sp. Marseille-P9652 TaxID=2654950 RepID=UPI0012E89330|nr:YkvA family protein [Mycobacterium sp. Marseille-P9652]
MWSIVIGALSGILLAWLILVAAIWLAKPDDIGVGEMIRLLPDLLRLFKRVATDRAVPRMVRVELVLLLCYLVSPIDLIPDFIPVIGFLDDALVVAIMLRIVVRTAGPQMLEKHWPGTPQGLGAVRRLCGLAQPG